MIRRVLALVLLTALMLLFSTTATYAGLGDNGFGANGCTPNRGGDVKCVV